MQPHCSTENAKWKPAGHWAPQPEKSVAPFATQKFEKNWPQYCWKTQTLLETWNFG